MEMFDSYATFRFGSGLPTPANTEGLGTADSVRKANYAVQIPRAREAARHVGASPPVGLLAV
jgi:hypothetical protein